jgi:hypothetical protein
VDVEAAVAC